MERDASNIYNDVVKLRNELEQLGISGRISMTQDSLNPDYRDASTALMTALEALQTAADATCWMETRRSDISM